LAGIAFEPRVPGLGGALSGLEAGSAVRVTLAFARSLWERPALIPAVEEGGSPPSFIQTPTCDFNAFWSVEPSRAPVLVAWSGGARSRRLFGTDDDLARHALDDLSVSVGADRRALAEALAGVWMHDWRSDPFSLGAYSYIAAGGLNASAQIAQPVDHTLFFAGEATCAESIGTVEAALESGERAARNVLLALK
jgi:monoamine oxidase